MDEPQPDAELVQRILDGDAAAFEALHSRYRASAAMAAERIVGDPFEAEDVVQEAMVRVYTHLGQLADPQRFGPWLAAVVRRAALDHLRGRQAHPGPWYLGADIDALPAAAGESPDPIAPLVQQQEFDRAIARLGPKLQETLRLQYREGLTLAEIAARLNVPLGTVKRRVHRQGAQRRARRQVLPLRGGGRRPPSAPPRARAPLSALVRDGDLLHIREPALALHRPSSRAMTAAAAPGTSRHGLDRIEPTRTTSGDPPALCLLAARCPRRGASGPRWLGPAHAL